jgi:hypothetical protein
MLDPGWPVPGNPAAVIEDKPNLHFELLRAIWDGPGTEDSLADP